VTLHLPGNVVASRSLRCERGEAAEQRDAADEGRLEACGGAFIGALIVSQGKVVRPSQLIASVRRLLSRKRADYVAGDNHGRCIRAGSTHPEA
jgi:hypothetical protein